MSRKIPRLPTAGEQVDAPLPKGVVKAVVYSGPYRVPGTSGAHYIIVIETDIGTLHRTRVFQRSDARRDRVRYLGQPPLIETASRSCLQLTDDVCVPVEAADALL